MRSYGEYCALARGLDVVGDRWSLLVVRELLVGSRRYGELLAGLPGIATNLLAERLRHLQRHGVVEQAEGGRYRLTPWGEGLRQPLYALGRWSAPVTMTRPAGDDAYRSDWLTHAAAVIFGGPNPRRGDVTVEVRVGDSPMTLASRGGRVTVETGAPPAPDVVVAGPPDAVLGVLAGALDPSTATGLGVQLQGDTSRLRWLCPSLFRRADRGDAATGHATATATAPVPGER